MRLHNEIHKIVICSFIGRLICYRIQPGMLDMSLLTGQFIIVSCQTTESVMHNLPWILLQAEHAYLFLGPIKRIK